MSMGLADAFLNEYKDHFLPSPVNKKKSVEKITKDENFSITISKSKIGDKLLLKNLFFYDRTDILYPESFPGVLISFPIFTGSLQQSQQDSSSRVDLNTSNWPIPPCPLELKYNVFMSG